MVLIFANTFHYIIILSFSLVS